MQNNGDNITNSTAPRRSSLEASIGPAFPPPAPSHDHNMGSEGQAYGYTGHDGAWYPFNNAANTTFPNPTAQQQAPYWRTCYRHTANPRASGACHGGICGPNEWFHEQPHAPLHATTPAMPFLDGYFRAAPAAPASQVLGAHMGVPSYFANMSQASASRDVPRFSQQYGIPYPANNGPTGSYNTPSYDPMFHQQGFAGYQNQSSLGPVYGDPQFGITNHSSRPGQPLTNHQVHSGTPTTSDQVISDAGFHLSVPNHPRQALIPVSQQHIAGSSLVTDLPPANGRLPSSKKPSRNSPIANALTSGTPPTESESDLPKRAGAIQRSHLPWHHKTIPKPRWDKQNPKGCWKRFRLTISDLQIGLIVYVIPNGEWSGNRPAIILSWENNSIRLLCCTSFSERDIWRKYAHFTDEWVAEQHKSQYLLISDGGRTRPHSFLPAIHLKQCMELPKTTYVDFYMEYECSIDDIIRFGDSDRSKINTYLVDQPSMAAIGWYLQVRHDLMVQTEQYEARKAHYRRVIGPDAAREAVTRAIQVSSEVGGGAWWT